MKGIVFILFFILAFFKTPLGDVQGRIPFYFGISFVLLIFIFWMFFYKKTLISKKKLTIFFYISIPFIVAYLINVIFKINYGFDERSFVLLIYWLISIFIAFVTTLLLGQRAIALSFFGFAFAFFLYILYIFIQNGIIESIKQVGVNSYFELHELSFALGLHLIYFFYDKNSKNVLKICISSILILLAFKRIEFFALTICFFMWFFKKDYHRVHYKLIFSCIIIIIIGYVLLIYSNSLSEIFLYFSIDDTGRIDVYNNVLDYLNKNDLLFGKGLGWTIDNLVSLEYNYRGYQDLHNDILKFFIEIGIPGGLLFWILYFFYTPLKIIKLIPNNKDIWLYITILIYNLILFLTDNTIRYLLVNIVFFQIIFVIADSNNKRVNELIK